MSDEGKAEWGSARGRLLKAAQEMMIEEFSVERTKGQAVARAFAFLDPARVAKRAGVARSAFYHHWGRPPEGDSDGLSPFQRFVGEVFELEWGEPFDPNVAHIAAGHKGSFRELTRRMAEVEAHRYDDPVAWSSLRASIALAAYGGSSEENIDAMHEFIGAFYDQVLERFDRRVTAPLTTFDIAAAVTAYLDGLWMRRLYGSSDANPSFEWPDPDSGEVDHLSLAAIGVEALVMAMSEPDPDASG